MEISDRDLLLDLHEPFKQFCSLSLQNSGIFSFQFDRNYVDGYGFTLNSISPDLSKQYYLFDAYPTYQELETYYHLSKYAYLDRNFSIRNHVVTDTKKWETNIKIQHPFSIDERFCILYKNKHYFDTYSFSYGSHNKKPLGFYIENLVIFEKFITYFNHAAKELIADCEKYRVHLPLNFETNFCQAKIIDTEQELFLNQLENLIHKSLQNSNLYLKNVKITKTQERCLSLLATGLTVKQVAKRMEISYRTVEQHVSNLKDKFQFNNMKQLIHLFLLESKLFLN